MTKRNVAPPVADPFDWDDTDDPLTAGRDLLHELLPLVGSLAAAVGLVWGIFTIGWR